MYPAATMTASEAVTELFGFVETNVLAFEDLYGGKLHAAVACPLRSGEASLHHPFTLHCSASNLGSQWRFGVALNYVSANVSPIPGYKESALHVAGKDWNTSFQRDPVPSSVLSEESLLALDHAVSLAAARYSDV